jgi:hypothetical protein
MSDVAQTTEVVVSTPTPVVEAPAPVLTNQSPKDAAKASLFASLAASQEKPVEAAPVVPVTEAPTGETAPVIDANGRPHAADGKFLPVDGSTAKTEPVSAPSIRVPVPEGHWLRDQGVAELPATDETEARRIRGLLKDASRRSEVSTLREELVRTQAQLKAAQEARQGIIANPDVLARINELRALGHDDLADAALRGLDSQSSEKAKEYEQEARARFTEEDAKAQALEFHGNTLDAARTKYPDFFVNSPRFNTAFAEAWDAYCIDVTVRENRGEAVKLSPDGVWKYLTPIYLADKDAQAIAKQRIAQRRQPTVVPNDAAQRHATLPPLAAIPSTARTGQLSTQPAAFNKTGMSAQEIKNNLKRELISR